MWKNFGTYKVKAQYGFSHIVAQTSFDLVDTVMPSRQTFHLNVGDQSFDVPYTISGGTVNDMKVDFPSIALILSINATKNGHISLDLPRNFIDSKKMDGSDETFIAIINGSEVDPSEPLGISSSRNVTVNFLKEDSQIELIGTQIVPEFPLSVPILLIGFVSLLVFQKMRIKADQT